jgi:hypothetical protein
MSLVRLAKLVNMLDAQFQFSGGDQAQDIGGALLEFFTGGDVLPERGAREEQGALLPQLVGVEWRDRPAGSAKKDEVTTRAENVQIFLEGALSDAIVDDVDPFSLGDAFGFHFKVLTVVENHFIGARFASQLRFGLRASRTNHARSNVSSHLDEKKSDSTCGRMNERRFPLL